MNYKTNEDGETVVDWDSVDLTEENIEPTIDYDLVQDYINHLDGMKIDTLDFLTQENKDTILNDYVRGLIEYWQEVDDYDGQTLISIRGQIETAITIHSNGEIKFEPFPPAESLTHTNTHELVY